ncbi:uncharacterized protein E0L32_004904 [Thyridium curvatum]|uniref:Uncharacterized protein n=1 Tax=Thyridium curvatum TaxID=1093900 RepID=A0A507B8Y6_9PEZI|nr:uncharacterized protein E0L32_004904 [Thyridium curvatum]TPX15074.1 hypothetical protein E0L32_004904 [Thyridium curvatum]
MATRKRRGSSQEPMPMPKRRKLSAGKPEGASGDAEVRSGCVGNTASTAINHDGLHQKDPEETPALTPDMPAREEIAAKKGGAYTSAVSRLIPSFRRPGKAAPAVKNQAEAESTEGGPDLALAWATENKKDNSNPVDQGRGIKRRPSSLDTVTAWCRYVVIQARNKIAFSKTEKDLQDCHQNAMPTAPPSKEPPQGSPSRERDSATPFCNPEQVMAGESPSVMSAKEEKKPVEPSEVKTKEDGRTVQQSKTTRLSEEQTEAGAASTKADSAEERAKHGRMKGINAELNEDTEADFVKEVEAVSTETQSRADLAEKDKADPAEKQTEAKQQVSHDPAKGFDHNIMVRQPEHRDQAEQTHHLAEHAMEEIVDGQLADHHLAIKQHQAALPKAGNLASKLVTEPIRGVRHALDRVEVQGIKEKQPRHFQEHQISEYPNHRRGSRHREGGYQDEGQRDEDHGDEDHRDEDRREFDCHRLDLLRELPFLRGFGCPCDSDSEWESDDVRTEYTESEIDPAERAEWEEYRLDIDSLFHDPMYQEDAQHEEEPQDKVLAEDQLYEARFIPGQLYREVQEELEDLGDPSSQSGSEDEIIDVYADYNRNYESDGNVQSSGSSSDGSYEPDSDGSPEPPEERLSRTPPTRRHPTTRSPTGQRLQGFYFQRRQKPRGCFFLARSSLGISEPL